MYLNFDISIIAVYIAGASLLCSIIVVSMILLRYGAIPRFCKKEAEGKIDYVDSLAPVSVIVYASNDADNIERNLPLLLQQDYPQYEVIVVNDGTTDYSKDILAKMELEYPNLYQTYVPTDTCNLSSKKLSLTLGVKAAKYDIILNTAANCAPQSNGWLRNMMRNFTDNTDLVIGYSHNDYQRDNGYGKFYRIFDQVSGDVQYLSYAIRNKAYRGTGNNLAYRKSLFFEHKGFSKSLNLHYGDDDIFVNSVVTATNTKVELSPESQMVSYYSDISQSWQELKLRYGFTARYLHTRSFGMAKFFMLILWLTLMLSISIALIDPHNWFNLSSASLCIVLPYVIAIVMYRKSSKHLQAPNLCLSVPFFMMMKPIINLRYRLMGHGRRITNYTWQRRK